MTLPPGGSIKQLIPCRANNNTKITKIKIQAVFR